MRQEIYDGGDDYNECMSFLDPAWYPRYQPDKNINIIFIYVQKYSSQIMKSQFNILSLQSFEGLETN